jgi:peptidylprolyl isomerase
MLVPYGPEAQMIPGFKEGLQQMNVGDKAILYIPAHLAYGERGAGNVIPPNTDLIFELEMMGIQE